MKKIFLFILSFILYIGNTSGQADLKFDIVNALEDEYVLSFEYQVKPKISLELVTGWTIEKRLIDNNRFFFRTSNLRKENTYFQFATKYYFKPKYGIDRYFVGTYLGSRMDKYIETLADGSNSEFRETALNLGIQTGRKWVMSSRLLIGVIFGAEVELIDKEATIPSNNSSPLFGPFFSSGNENGSSLWFRINVGYRF